MTNTGRFFLTGVLLTVAGFTAPPAAAASRFTIQNITIDYGRAVAAFNARKNGVKIGSAQEVINLTNDIMKVQVANTGTPMVFCMSGEIWDLNLNKVIGVGGITSIRPLPTGTMTLAVNDFSNGWSANTDPAYNKWLEDQYRQADGLEVLTTLMAHRYKFTVWPCDDPSQQYSYFFTLNSPTNDPLRLGSPQDNADVCPDGLRFNWNTALLDGVPAASYRVEVFEGEEGVNRIFDSGPVLGTFLFYPASGPRLRADLVYTWRVTASDSNNGRSQASRLYRFRARCAGTQPVGLLDLESYLRRTRPDLMAQLGSVKLVAVGSPDGGLESAALQQVLTDVKSGKARIDSADLVLGKDGKDKDKKPGGKKPEELSKGGDKDKEKDQDKGKDKEKEKEKEKEKPAETLKPAPGGKPAPDEGADQTKPKGKKP